MIAVNGQSPGPLLEANFGDRIVVNVINQLSNATAIQYASESLRRLLTHTIISVGTVNFKMELIFMMVCRDHRLLRIHAKRVRLGTFGVTVSAGASILGC